MYWGIKRQVLCLSFFPLVPHKRSNPSSPRQHFHNCCLQDSPLTKSFCEDWLLPVAFQSVSTWSFHKSCWKIFTQHMEEQHSGHSGKNYFNFFFCSLASAHPWRWETWHCCSVSQADGCPSLGVPRGPGLSASCCQAAFTTDLPSFSSFLWGKRKSNVQRHNLALSPSHFALLNLSRNPPFLPCRYCTVFQLDTYKPKLHFPFQGVVQGFY